MRIKKSEIAFFEGDVTPMIDMTFQLIAFFMVLINFSQNETNQAVQLPESELAKPPEGPLEFPVTLHLTSAAQVIIGDQRVPIAGLGPFLVREANALRAQGLESADATIIIRADGLAMTGRVQELIQVCRDNRFENFVLRAKEDVGD